ncbi:M23 family metallopeptidase [Pseudidiomarina sp. 1APP75-32.1]|uniref:M23 family metallopeptidase n=1 Tax=Pseudidiomarina terrestris TaxID=2820060 RepID=A0AAW7QTX2_9GAMM|nr:MULTISPECIES: M23 family metallopeptidase [unclassified Pseudidiomarina]MDN7123716.1 M23 family metallopeptidase [Pseudidiomarina sp. 1APP75-32.1]MDN7128560.1 M23 family metallopeptidase [Pseudidiomarina sp. 1APR75-15]
MRKLSFGLLLTVFGCVAASSAISQANETQPLLELTGARTAGALMIAKTDPSYQVALNGEALEVSDNGIVVFGFERDSEGVQELTLTLADGRQVTQQIELEPRSYVIDRVEGVPQRTVTPDPEQVARARKEAAAVWQARQTFSTRQDFLQPIIEPAQGRISGVYGSQRIFNGEPRNPHYGLDVAAPTGTPVKVVWSGKVVFADDDLFYSGGTIIVDHGQGLTTTYIHLSEVKVQVGDEVEQGTVIGAIGATGRATGPHLDWRVNWRNVRLDPALVLEHF